MPAMDININVPARTLESYKPLSSSFEMDESPIEHISYPQQVLNTHDHGHARQNNYYSNGTMWICCRCGDGPKIYLNQMSAADTEKLRLYAELDRRSNLDFGASMTYSGIGHFFSWNFL
ncbi:hypothetical protein BJX99DRAFT_265633 [Aspergillus californicus]